MGDSACQLLSRELECTYLPGCLLIAIVDNTTRASDSLAFRPSCDACQRELAHVSAHFGLERVTFTFV